MKIGFLSLGCAKNLVDGEVMLGLAQQAGHEITTDGSHADVLVVNTCAFIDSAKQESVNAILEMAELKRSRPGARLVVTGCLAERYREELKREIPEIDAVLGTGEVPEIVGAIEGPANRLRQGYGESCRSVPVMQQRAEAGHHAPNNGNGTAPLHFFRESSIAPVPSSPLTLPNFLYDAETPRVLTTPRHFAYIKIAEGCDYTCAFCIIPTLRGKYRSRPAESIVREARSLAARGVREIILISQDTTFYGIDRGERGALARLLRELNAIDALEWIRLLYLYPTTIGDDVIDAIAECDKVCRYIDLPLQHASNAVLKRMGRPGTRDTYTRLLAKIRQRVPDVTLRTTLIVGFPGETEQNFEELCRFIADVEFDHIGVFSYSHEEGTRAYGMDDDVPAAVKRRRRNRLMSLQKRIVAHRQRARVGERARVLVDGPSPDHPLVLQGRLEGQAPEVDPVVYLSDCDPSAYVPGQLVSAQIVAARGYDLVARPLP